MTTGLAALVVAILLLPAAAAAAEADPDRPDLSASARTVSRGAVQLESGGLYQRTSRAGARAERRLAVEASVRVGVLDWLELRLDGEPFVRLRGEEQETGHGDAAVAAKVGLWQPPPGSRRPALALLPFVKLPLADEPIGTERPDGGVTAIATFALPADFGLDVNARLAAVSQRRPGGVLLQAFTSASLSRALGPVSVFGEFFFSTRDERDAGDEAGVHAGLVYVLAPSVAVDASLLTSVVGRAPDYAVRAGLTVRFGR